MPVILLVTVTRRRLPSGDQRGQEGMPGNVVSFLPSALSFRARYKSLPLTYATSRPSGDQVASSACTSPIRRSPLAGRATIHSAESDGSPNPINRSDRFGAISMRCGVSNGLVSVVVSPPEAATCIKDR